MFSKILFPVDGSDHSNKTFDYVKDLAKTYDCEVVLFHAYNTPVLYTVEFGDSLKKAGSSLLNKTEEKFKKEGINVKTNLSEGYAGKEIITLAERENCDLIIMGTQGASEVKNFLIGSTSNFVIHHAKCPVLLVN